MSYWTTALYRLVPWAPYRAGQTCACPINVFPLKLTLRTSRKPPTGANPLAT